MTDEIRTVPGTNCWQLRDKSQGAPYVAVCRCGWWLPNLRSKRATKRAWHRHLRAVRDGLARASAS